MPAKSPPLTARAEKVLADLAAQLRQHRRSLKINGTAAAEAAGVSRSTLHRIEAGNPSVTAGAVIAEALALGFRLELAPIAKAPRAVARKGWIPARVRLEDYPKLKELAWHVHGTDELTPREALDIYQRNWRHIDQATLGQEERDLVDALRAALSGNDAV
jgi:DNA-binding XRE family transcriptional regulator